jgi:hypothetical protein
LNINRMVVQLQRVAAVFFGAGVLFVAGAIVWPGSVESLVDATGIAAAAFGFPAGLAFVVAHWLDTRTPEGALRDGIDENADREHRP